jgi:Flp pilus assembly secretin CpaC
VVLLATVTEVEEEHPVELQEEVAEVRQEMGQTLGAELEVEGRETLGRLVRVGEIICNSGVRTPLG